MRNFSDAFNQHLSSGATTLCRCWKLIRADGVGLGFTDHDRDLTFGDVVFAADSGLEGSELESKIGLAIGGTEIVGALTSASLTDAALLGGAWDNASVETWLVNWADPSVRVLLDLGQIGEIRSEDSGFTAEVRGVAQRFDEEQGRIYQAACNADLGDQRCKIDIGLAAFHATGFVVATDGRLGLSVSLERGFDSGWFDGGMLRFTGGANEGNTFEIRQHFADAGNGQFVLWRQTATHISPGDHVTVTAGCDKRLDTCRTKFANAYNFRGFPSIPTNDFILTYARQGDSSQNGGVLP